MRPRNRRNDRTSATDRRDRRKATRQNWRATKHRDRRAKGWRRLSQTIVNEHQEQA